MKPFFRLRPISAEKEGKSYPAGEGSGRQKSALRIFRRKKERKVSKENKAYNNALILVNKKFYINN